MAVDEPAVAMVDKAIVASFPAAEETIAEAIAVMLFYQTPSGPVALRQHTERRQNEKKKDIAIVKHVKALVPPPLICVVREGNAWSEGVIL
jgi:hypothetical protein